MARARFGRSCSKLCPGTTEIQAQSSTRTKRDLGTILWAIDENMGTNLQAVSVHRLSESTKTEIIGKQQFTYKICFNSGRALCKSGRAQGNSGRAQDSKGRAQRPKNMPSWNTVLVIRAVIRSGDYYMFDDDDEYDDDVESSVIALADDDPMTHDDDSESSEVGPLQVGQRW